VKVVIVGSGLAGFTVAETLGKPGKHEVTLITAETSGYYSRPRLSHGIPLGDEAAAKIVMKPYSALAGVKVESGRTVQRISELDYDALVLATGSSARIPPPLLTHRNRFFTVNSYDDLLALRRLRGGAPKRWAVVGGGLIGCEVASDLNKAGDAVTLFHREDRLLELLLPPAQSQALDEHFVARGIEIRYQQDLQAPPEGFDGVIVAVGFAPRIQLAKDAGLATNRGIVVDEYLRTSDPKIFAVGDVAEVKGKIYAFVSPIRAQALWLASFLNQETTKPWEPPAFKPVMKIHDFKP
jgi:NAD(P)H-nitrite reductase large subunit